jgi:nucleoid-associated protein YgaU
MRPRADGERCGPERYTVQPGDSLWSIAQAKLASDDPRRVARYWPLIHRANRAQIGSTPDLILPGWTLNLPPECD